MQKPPKPLKAKRFDPYLYFKDEFRLNHLSLNDDDLEKVKLFFNP
jgi:hypothetical protein